MKLFGRIALGLLALVALVVGGGLLYLRLGFPKKIPVHAIRVPKGDTALIARGKYLSHHVAPCFVCHSPRDHHKFSEPVILDSMGAGKVGFGHNERFPGEMYFYNITPHRLGNWSDGELYRVINSGLTKEGEPVFPFMPYQFIGKMDSTDIVAIIAYLRTIPSIAKESGKTEMDFPVNLIMRTLPERQKQFRNQDLTTPELRGEYLSTIGGCVICHTPVDDKHQIIPEHIFEGGRKIYLPTGAVVVSANVTPDPETGIGLWTERSFINRFHSYANARTAPDLGPNDPQTAMPWAEYAGMKEEDLKDIFAYLKSLRPVKKEDSPYYHPPGSQEAKAGM